MAIFSLLITTCVAIQGVKTECVFSGTSSRDYPSEATCQENVRAVANRAKFTLSKTYQTASIFSKGDCFTPELYSSVLLGIPEFAQMLDANYTFEEYAE